MTTRASPCIAAPGRTTASADASSWTWWSWPCTAGPRPEPSSRRPPRASSSPPRGGRPSRASSRRRKRNREYRSAIDAALDLDPAAVCLGDLPREVEAQTEARIARRRNRPLESVEDPRLVPVVDADSLIADDDLRRALRLAHFHRDGLSGAVLERIAEKRVDQLGEPQRISHHVDPRLEPRLDRHSGSRELRGNAGDRLADDPGKLDRAQFQTDLSRGEGSAVQHRLDEPHEPIRLPLHEPREVLSLLGVDPLLPELHLQPQRGERRAQLVRRHPDEVVAELQRSLRGLCESPVLLESARLRRVHPVDDARQVPGNRPEPENRGDRLRGGADRWIDEALPLPDEPEKAEQRRDEEHGEEEPPHDHSASARPHEDLRERPLWKAGEGASGEDQHRGRAVLGDADGGTDPVQRRRAVEIPEQRDQRYQGDDQRENAGGRPGDPSARGKQRQREAQYGKPGAGDGRHPAGMRHALLVARIHREELVDAQFDPGGVLDEGDESDHGAAYGNDAHGGDAHSGFSTREQERDSEEHQRDGRVDLHRPRKRFAQSGHPEEPACDQRCRADQDRQRRPPGEGCPVEVAGPMFAFGPAIGALHGFPLAEERSTDNSRPSAPPDGEQERFWSLLAAQGRTAPAAGSTSRAGLQPSVLSGSPPQSASSSSSMASNGGAFTLPSPSKACVRANTPLWSVNTSSVRRTGSMSHA